LVLVEGHAGSPVEKIWLLSDGEDGEPAAAGISLVLGRSENRRAKCLSFIDDFLQEKQLRTPLWACILIGGRSSRMGQPKHLLAANQDTSWLERTVETVSPLVEGVALSGAGEVMESLESLPRIGDIPGLKGPMTGLLSAMRFQPRTSWLLIGCDMPSISSEAINWLLQNRLPGIWATMPRLSAKAPVEPLLACYDFRCRYLVEELAVNDIRRIRKIAKSSKVIKPVIPKEFVSAWHNINTPGELTEFTGSS
ncbi:MAG: molybdenum cofactor guanylyltransferase, partial [Thermodesulfobacteriota bacterium]